MSAKNFIICLLTLFATAVSTYSYSLAEEIPTLTGSVVAFPSVIFGLWRVKSQLTDTNAPNEFRNKGVDFWNLRESNNVIKLSNPFSGAEAELKIEKYTKNYIEFSKSGKYGNRILTDNVSINITDNNFYGTNTLHLDTFSEKDNTIIKTEYAKYNLSGEKIAGQELRGF